MCGIAGWIDWERDLLGERDAVQRMAAAMACRGPDAEGVWVSGSAALAHRRLAVIDVAGGIQPMPDKSGHYACSSVKPQRPE